MKLIAGWFEGRQIAKRLSGVLREHNDQVLAGRVLREGLISEAGIQFMRGAREDAERWSREERNILFSMCGIEIVAALILAPISIPLCGIVGMVTAVGALYLLQRGES